MNEPRQHGLLPPVDRDPHCLLQGRDRVVQPLLELRDVPVRTREDPRRRTLEDGELTGRFRHVRDELHRGGPRAQDRHALAAQVVVVVPLGAVEHRALEVLDPGNVRVGRLAERPGTRDQELAPDSSGARLDLPLLVVFHPRRPEDLRVEHDVGHHAEPHSGVTQVAVQLGLLREGSAPPRVGSEREGVQVRGDVAGTARVVVVAPRTSHVVRLLQHDEVVSAFLLQAHGGGQAGEAAADDGHTAARGQFGRHLISVLDL